jgi:[calcium/calmodulin-dependent protein kinase] kinase
LNKDAQLRPKIPEIAKHPWLNAGNMNLWDEMYNIILFRNKEE